MICQKCKQKEATTHIKQIIGGELREGHFCSDCAIEQGYANIFTNSAFGINSIFKNLLAQTNSYNTITEEKHCPCCNSTFSQISKSGKVGCGKCYEVFAYRLTESIQRIHGNTKHIGKVPKTASKKAQFNSRLESARVELQQSIEKQDFEKAAILRDEIIALESKVKDNE